MSNLGDVLVYMFPGIRLSLDCEIRTIDGVVTLVNWYRHEPQPTPAEIAAAELPAAKSARIEADRQECRRRLTEFYGDALEQGSRFAGGYGEAAQANILAGTVAARVASNTARDAVNAATTVEQVEAVTVQWPVLT